MNKKQEFQLKYAAANLTRADQVKNLQGMADAHGMIKKSVTEIYKGKIAVPTVLRVEEILNDGQANVLGKASNAYKQMEILTGQTETGMKAYRVFDQIPESYVQGAYTTRTGVLKGKPFRNGIPYDPVRSALTEFREQLARELTQRTGNPFQDSLDANKLRLNATIAAERDFLGKILRHHSQEIPEKKQEHIRDFDGKMAKLTRGIEPPEA